MIEKQIIENLGFKSLNPIQEAMLRCKADNRILLAPTGAGKTLAYLLPALRRVRQGAKAVQVIIIAPSRELALQIDTVFRSTKSGESISCVYGGHSIHTEKRSLEYNPTFVVATPGRLLDHLSHHNIDCSTVTHLIFDEFDKLLELGFSEEISEIVSLLPSVRYRTLTSATSTIDYPDYIAAHPFETIDFLTGKASGELTVVKIQCSREERLAKLIDLLSVIGNEPTIIFCNFREQAEEVSDYLYDLHIESEYFHGGMEQFDRERSLTKFRNHSVNILVSTDLAARGLDIPNIKHII
ncbi:MAG: DEAD/DEAH box helicase, partial [Rikenellaceae bacterium]